MPNQMSELHGPLLSRLASVHDLVWRDHRIRVTVPNVVGGPPVVGRFVFPSRVPFLVTDIAWSSIRDYDGAMIDHTLRSRERTFVDEFEPLELLGNRVNAGGPPRDAIAFFRGNEELIWSLQRLFPVNPAEVYPGVAQDSIITLRLGGVEIWPKGSQLTETDYSGEP